MIEQEVGRWYIRKYVRYDKNLSAITNLKHRSNTHRYFLKYLGM